MYFCTDSCSLWARIMKKNGIYGLLTIAVIFISAMSASASDPRPDKIAVPVVSLEQPHDQGLHHLEDCAKVFTANHLRITECRHNEAFSRVISGICLTHSEIPVLRKSPDAILSSHPDLNCRYTGHRLHLFSRLNI